MYVVQGQVTNRHHFPFFVVDDDGWFVNPHEIKFRIVRKSDGSQVFPYSGWEDVTDDGHSAGYFYACDVSESKGWTVGAAEATGECYIEWAWSLTPTSAEQTATRRFWIENSAEFDGVAWMTYLAPAQVRDEGVPVSELSNSRLEDLILDAQDYVENMTHNVFRPIWQDFRMNGPHAAALFLPLPIIGLSALYVNNSTTAVTVGHVRVNHARIDQLDRAQVRPDPRRNPWVRWRNTADSGVGFNWPVDYESSQFHRGAGNQRVVGAFGFVERDGSVPRKISRAMLGLVLANAEPLEIGDAQPSGPVVSRATDRNSISYAASGVESQLAWAGASAKWIEEILIAYKRPIAMGTTTPSRSWRA